MRTRNNMEGLDSAVMKHICMIFGLPPNTSQDRLRIILGEPNIEMKLAIRQLKIFHKYRRHFKESPSEHRNQLINYFSMEVVDGECDDEEYARLGYELEQKNLAEIFGCYYADLGMKLRKGHRKFIRTYIKKSSNIKDYYFLRYIGNVCKTTNKRLFPECVCGKMNDEGHGANECEQILNTQK
jgi:hypothetical protein